MGVFGLDGVGNEPELDTLGVEASGVEALGVEVLGVETLDVKTLGVDTFRLWCLGLSWDSWIGAGLVATVIWVSWFGEWARNAGTGLSGCGVFWATCLGSWHASVNRVV